jgi:ankyrin repeat protein
MELARMPEVEDSTWDAIKNYLQKNPEVAKSLKILPESSEDIRGWLQTQAMAEHYNLNLVHDDANAGRRLRMLEQDPELAQIFEDIRTQGVDAALRYCSDDALMLKITDKMGTAHGEPKHQGDEDIPVSLHEACKTRNVEAVQGYLRKQLPSIDVKDGRGITPIGYAIGGYCVEIVRLLLDNRADPHLVDYNSNSGLHYASGYGHQELVQLLLDNGADANKYNSEGQTPLRVASVNKHASVMKILKDYGGRM